MPTTLATAPRVMIAAKPLQPSVLRRPLFRPRATSKHRAHHAGERAGAATRYYYSTTLADSRALYGTTTDTFNVRGGPTRRTQALCGLDGGGPHDNNTGESHPSHIAHHQHTPIKKCSRSRAVRGATRGEVAMLFSARETSPLREGCGGNGGRTQSSTWHVCAFGWDSCEGMHIRSVSHPSWRRRANPQKGEVSYLCEPDTRVLCIAVLIGEGRRGGSLVRGRPGTKHGRS